MDKQHEDELSVSVAEKIGSRRKEKSEERKGAKRSEKERKGAKVPDSGCAVGGALKVKQHRAA